ncbi:unnamed protein product [Caenorhabditis nigoni]
MNTSLLIFRRFSSIFHLSSTCTTITVIGGERSDHLIPVPLSSAPTDQAIRVVKAFQAGLDRREPSLTGQSAARLREISRQLRLQVDSENRARSTSRGNIKETNNL